MKLTVKPLVANRPGEPTAVVERDAMADLGLESGDYVVLKGPADESAVAEVTARPSEEADERTIRLAPELAETLGVTAGETVSVEPADVGSAERVEIALPDDVDPDQALALSQRDALVGRVLSSGQTTTVSVAAEPGSSAPSRRVPIEIVDVEPSAYVCVEEWTSIVVAPEPASPSTVDDPERTASANTGVTYDEIGGLDDELERVREVIELPMRHPDLFDRLGVDPPTGVLLYGPPGTGKTLLARAMANEVGAHFQTLSGPEIVSKYYGESEERLRQVFEEAAANAPAIVFVDEIDAIAPKREDVGGDVERRIVAQLLSLLDGADDRGQVVVVGTTNRVDAVDPALRRPGRFDREIEVGVPDADERADILQIHARGVPLSDDVDLERYAESTHGFVGADLENLVRESAMCALRRVRSSSPGDADTELSIDRPEAVEIVDADVETALHGIEPSAMREVVVEGPDVGWADVGGLSEAKRTLREAVQWPLEYPDAFERVSLRPTTGILLSGPPGTGKTLLTRAVATEAQSNFISIKGPELVDKYVGESEKAVREIFGKARENAPAVLVFDEIDAIAGARGGSGESDVGERVVSQLLTELDGLEEFEDVVVIGTTNRPDRLDDALLRTGRFEREVSVGAPDQAARRDIFEIHLRDRPLASDVELDALAARTDGFVGADIDGLCRRAATAAVREYVEGETDGRDRRTDVRELELTNEHFERALEAADGTSPGESARRGEPIDPFDGGERGRE
ncbi:CDC48 family AAA ATPase [Natrinema salifodinae]|uniref:Transitional endoplasmic reticulum ATPase n=1 Tax=Natrinema salifodinae TaxID=1202768 RepID=A0A1I0QT77_9EURY|nr:CDC48 family AAA ATPase [Natrinema salifodinae]SEW30552.1 transitional endoplasmic reticulum ATPase [Natrinema salifodinae]